MWHCEVFSEIGLAVKEQWPQPPLLATCSNGYVGYVPMADAYPLGGYEIGYWWKWWRYPGPFHPSVGALFQEEMVKLGRSLGH